MNKGKSIFWGLVLIVVGLLFLGNNLNWWNVNLFFDGWWSLFIIVPSLIGMSRRETFSSSLVSLVLGILLLLAAQDIISWGMIWKIIVPLIIIVVGLSLIFGRRDWRKFDGKNAGEYVAIFSGVDEKLKEVDNDFRVISIFGGVELDLRKAKLKKDLVIECVSVFGGIDLKMPDKVQLRVNGMPIFGGVENKFDNDESSEIIVYINYTCIFGGIDIL